eukprot:9471052-Pyramimonas_sp.AAC.1
MELPCFLPARSEEHDERVFFWPRSDGTVERGAHRGLCFEKDSGPICARVAPACASGHANRGSLRQVP